jgi:hypothetical protein
MREAAEEFTTRHDTARARSAFQAVRSTFWEEGQRPIRDSAESSLTRLDGLEKGAP